VQDAGTTTCSQAQTGSAVITVNPLPTATITGTTAVCKDAAAPEVTFTGAAGTAPYTFTYSINGGSSLSVTTTSGNSVTVAAPTGTSGIFTYTLLSVQDAGGTTCSQAQTGSAVITVNPLPVPVISGPSSACATSLDNVYSTAAISGHTYAWVVSGGTINGSASENAISVTWGTGATGMVKVTETIMASSCAVATANYQVIIHALPVAPTAGNLMVCFDGMTHTGTATAGKDETIVWYTTAIAGTIISAPNGTSTGTYNAFGTARVVATGCECATRIPVTVTINALPAAPTITGSVSATIASTGNVYTTETGMKNYLWTVSAGGTVTAGGGATNNAVTISWNTAGAQFVMVNYTNANNCPATAATVKNVTIIPILVLPPPLPTPVAVVPVATIQGPTTVCSTTSGNVYTTEAGMINYGWSVSSGGVITAGGTSTSPSVTITWNTPGTRNVSVKYANPAGVATASASMNVLVNPAPEPIITGPSNVCEATNGNVYSTETGMTGYTWTVSAGGNLTSGGTAIDATVTVTWNTAGARNVNVNYTNLSGCRSTTAGAKNVTVNPMSIPVISGSGSSCLNSSGNVYSTNPGMTGYKWHVSSGGTITHGGSSEDASITVTWNAIGTQSVSVNYYNSNGCVATTGTTKVVPINSLPVTTISGSATACATSATNAYTTESGMTGYTWTISDGGTITSGSETNTILVRWNSTGTQSLGVSYTNPDGCTAIAPASKSVTVNPLPGNAGSITGESVLCGGTRTVVYSIAPIADATNYVWTVPAGATIASGSGKASIAVNYAASATSGMMSVYGSNTCGNSNTSTLAIGVTQFPAAAGSIDGPSSVCQGSKGLTFSIPQITNATSYIWSVPTGSTIVSGASTSSIVVDLAMSATSGLITVYGSNTCGQGVTSPVFSLMVNQIPSKPFIAATGTNVMSSASSGNQWYFSSTATGSGSILAGSMSQVHLPAQDGWYLTKVTLNGCSSEVSNHVFRLMAGEPIVYNVYPVPNRGIFTVSVLTPDQQEFTIIVYDQIGQKIWELSAVMINGEFKQEINLGEVPTGIYSILFRSRDGDVIKKFNVSK
jgi:hypothetical protein